MVDAMIPLLLYLFLTYFIDGGGPLHTVHAAGCNLLSSTIPLLPGTLAPLRYDGFSNLSPSVALKPWISLTSSLRMNSIVSALITCPGTMMGKPGGYGITKFAETSSGPSFSRLSSSGLASFRCSHCCARYALKNAARISPSHVLLEGSSRKRAEKLLKLGRLGTSVIKDLTRAAKVCCAAGPPSASCFSIFSEISTRTLISCAMSLRVLLMLV